MWDACRCAGLEHSHALAKSRFGYDIYRGEPVASLIVPASYDRAENTALVLLHTTKGQHTTPPNQFQRIAQNGLFALCRGIGGVEDKRLADGKKPVW